MRISDWSSDVCSSDLASAVAAYLLLPTYSWRWMFAIPGISCLLLLILSRAMPESPRWLAGQGRDAEADAIVTKFEDDKRGVISSDRTTVLAPPTIADVSIPQRFKTQMRIVVACLILIHAKTGPYYK